MVVENGKILEKLERRSVSPDELISELRTKVCSI